MQRDLLVVVLLRWHLRAAFFQPIQPAAHTAASKSPAYSPDLPLARSKRPLG